MIRKRRKPRAAAPSGDTKMPWESGPRWVSWSRIARTASADTGRLRSNDRSPQIPARCRLEKPRAIHDVGATLENGREQASVFARIELGVRILHQKDVAGRELQPDAHGRALTEVDWAVVALHARIADPPAGVD